MADRIRVLLAGAGTGGHLMPAIALAREIESRYTESEILFIGTKHGLEAKLLPELGYALRFIWLRGFQRSRIIGNALLPLQMIVSAVQCFRTLVKFKPDVVIGTGGYISGPALLLAAALRYPTLIQEQNSAPGISTRLLSRFVDQVHLSFEDSIQYFKKRDRIFVSGNPVRSNLQAVDRKTAAGRLGMDAAKRTLFVFGGSQGAHSINLAMLKVLAPLMEKTDWQILWSTGERDYETVQAVCAAMGSRIRVMPFIKDMASAYTVSDLVISRAGATTLAELEACGLPAILVPYPYAAAGHQEANARSLMAQDAVQMVLNHELESDHFLMTIFRLMGDDERRHQLGSNLKRLARPNAAKDIVDYMILLLKNEKVHQH